MLFRKTRSKTAPAAALLACLMAAEPMLCAAEKTPDADRITRAIVHLGDEDYRVREEASRWLWLAGKAAEPALRSALGCGSPEINSRASAILAEFEYGIYPDTPPELLSLLRAYRTGQAPLKREVLDKLIEAGRPAYPYLVRLAAVEIEPALRTQITRELIARAADMATAFLIDRDYANAAQLLDVVASSGSRNALRMHAAYLLLRGEADGIIARLRRQLEAGKAEKARLLAYLCRAKGDLAGARWAAGRIGEADLIEGILAEQGDWKALADRLQEQMEEEREIPRLGLLAASHRMAGNASRFEQALARIRQTPGGEEETQWLIAKSLLLNGRANEAIDRCIKANRHLEAFELLAAQQRYAEALALVEKAEITPDPRGLALLIAKAQVFCQLGHTEQGQGTFDTVAQHLAKRWDPDLYCRLIEAEVAVGQIQRAMERGAAAINVTKPSYSPAAFLASLFPDRSTEADHWFRFLRDEYRQEDPQAILARVRAVLDGRVKGEELDLLTRRAYQSQTETILRTIARTAIATGREEAARQLLVKLCKLPEASAAYLELGNLAAGKKDWAEAVQMYRLAVEKNKSSPAAAYLYGHALVQAGQAKEGQELIELAMLLPLADSTRRLELAEILDRAGLHDAAIEQCRLVLRMGELHGTAMAGALRYVAEATTQRGQISQAADLWARMVLECLPANAAFGETAAYLTIPQLAGRTRAWALVRAGRIDEALAEVESCLKEMPGDIQIAIDLMDDLAKQGRAKEAADLFGRVLVFQEKLIAQYPDSAYLRNNIAWLLARSRRNLDQALQHALRGVQLQPANTAMLDTLAEVYFQRNQKAQAIDTIRRCLELEPLVARHKEALRRFETATPDLPPPQ